MKKAFLLLCALLLALGSALPLAGYRLAPGARGAAVRLARAVLGRRADVPPAPASSTSAASEAAPAAFEGDADVFLIEDLSTGEVQQVPKRDYLIGAAAAEMPLTWPDEALKAQIVAAHSYALYCRDHASAANGSWLSADPARRQGYLTAGLPDRRRPPQLLGDRLRGQLCPSLGPRGRRPQRCPLL